MNLQSLLPHVHPDMWKAALQVGKTVKGEWFTPLYRTANRALVAECVIDTVKEASRVSGINLIRALYTDGFNTIATFETFIRLVTEGPKLFFPTVEQCEAMEHVDITLPLQDYRQCYPVLGIVFPDAYRKQLDERYKGENPTPRVTFLNHKPHLQFLYVCAPLRDMHESVYLIPADEECNPIEVSLKHHDNPNDPDLDISETLTRVALNLSLLLANSPTHLKPDNPTAYERAQRHLKKRPELESNQIDAATHVHRIITEQSVIVRQCIRRSKEDTPGTHKSPAAHWRRGHWRARPGDAEVRAKPLVFVRPCFVSGESGDDTATTVSYRV